MQEAYGGFAALYDPLMQDVDYDGWAGYLASFLPPSGMIVDCACGTGAITIRLARKGFSMIGVDISPEISRPLPRPGRQACGFPSSARIWPGSSCTGPAKGSYAPATG